MKSQKPINKNSTAPSPLLLSLVGSFLNEHGLDSTNKSLSKELKIKQAKNGWQVVGAEEDTTSVSLETLLTTWKENKEEDESETSDSNSESTSVGSVAGESTRDGSSSSASGEDESTDNDSSDSSSDDDEAPPARAAKKSKTQPRAQSPSSSSSSDSDADDEDEKPAKLKTAMKKHTHKAMAVKNPLKRKAESSSSESSGSESESSEDEQPTKKTKTSHVMTNGAANDVLSDASSDSESSSSEDSDDTSDSDEETPVVEIKDGTREFVKASSDSSGTVVGDKKSSSGPEGSASDMSVDNSDVPPRIKLMAELEKKKHIGAKPTRLAELSAEAAANSHISNAYKSYDYAERAYNDLSVTRGKGFTKEKNKKKRGSYRGGAIDISGGKGFKFED